MRDPARLEVLHRATELTRLTYAATESFPPSERHGLQSQMRRAAHSVGANIAEGCGRHTDRAFLSYLQIATGSVTELAYHASVATQLGFGAREQMAAVEAMADRVRRMLTKLTHAVKRKR